MNFVCSDIHGCYDEFIDLLAKISFTASDTLYIVGDVLDRGPKPVELLLDIMNRPNIVLLMGNHDFLASAVLKMLLQGALSKEEFALAQDWFADGGETTLKGFKRLPADRRMELIRFIDRFLLYKEVHVGGRSYLLVHGGLEPFAPEKPLEKYTPVEMLFSRPDYNKKYYDDKLTVTGHTPTLFEPGNTGTIIRRNNHIAIDCGCVFGGKLAAYCLETQEEFYVKSKGYWK